MMEETCWKQFMMTGKVEDYLKFKAESQAVQQSRKAVDSLSAFPAKGGKTEGFHAGLSKNDGVGTGQYTHRGV